MTSECCSTISRLSQEHTGEASKGFKSLKFTCDSETGLTILLIRFLYETRTCENIRRMKTSEPSSPTVQTTQPTVRTAEHSSHIVKVQTSELQSIKVFSSVCEPKQTICGQSVAGHEHT